MEEEFYLQVWGKSLDVAQRKFLKQLAEEVAERFAAPLIVNIGVLLGCSMVCFRAGAPHVELIGVDNDYERRSPKQVTKNYLRAKFIEGRSQEVHVQVRGPVHLLFIDGGHSYGACKGDIDGWAPKIPIGGIVSFHDCHMGGVSKALGEWQEEPNWAERWERIEGQIPGLRAYRRT